MSVRYFFKEIPFVRSNSHLPLEVTEREKIDRITPISKRADLYKSWTEHGVINCVGRCTLPPRNIKQVMVMEFALEFDNGPGILLNIGTRYPH